MTDETVPKPPDDARGIDGEEVRRLRGRLLASEQNVSQILHSSPVGISISRVQGGLILDMNDVFLRILGFTRDEVIGRTSHELGLWVAPDQRETIVREFQEKGTFSPRPVPMRRKDGEVVTVLFSASPLVHGDEPHTIAWVMDVTDRLREEKERLRMEAEVHQARRVESLGVLAGGIAHDFNNLLAAILGNAELALVELPDGEPRHLVEQIQAAGQHAADLTRQMLAYTGRGVVATERLELSSVVRRMAQLLAAAVPKKVELSLELGEGLPAVEADAAQLRQVVMNLVINAADAIGDREGRIVVGTGTAAAERAPADFTLGTLEPAQPSVFLEVADTGAGIDRAALPRIFDPFFTTRFAGRGLGLAAVQGIVLRHGGAIAVRTGAGGGSTFRVILPVAAAVAPAPALAPSPVPASQRLWRGSGEILLVDDEEPVRRMVARMLEALGFRALLAKDGREALETAAAHPGVRAVLLDLMMPRMDGRETAEELRRVRGDLPVILCSGYHVHEAAGAAAGSQFSGFLQKPYRLDDLVRELRRALGE